MAEIFVSYDSADRERVRALIPLLEAEGWSVWWDRELVVGPRYDEAIEQALSEASCVLVIWSSNSIRSHWVRDEAAEGLNNGILVPVVIDEIRPPLGFRSSETASLVGWPDQRGQIDRLIKGVRSLLESRRPTDNPTAWDLYRQGVERVALYNRWDARTAIEMLSRATTIDPDFADAWAYLADASLNAVVFFDSENVDLWQQAEEATNRALALDPKNVVAKTTQGRLLWSARKGFDNRGALRNLSEAIALQGDTHRAVIWQCCIFLHVGLSLEAQKRLLAVIESEPTDPLGHFFLAQTYGFLGDHGNALEAHARAISLDPTNQVIALHYPEKWIYADELNQAESSIQRARQIGHNDPILASSEALIWAKRGELRRAEAACEQSLMEIRSSTPHVHTHHVYHHIGSAYSLIDKPELAVEQIRSAAETGLPNSSVFETDAHLLGLHGNSAFESLLVHLRSDLDQYRSEFLEH
jgi:tetratricopeptide (TPR) repeat protein